MFENPSCQSCQLGHRCCHPCLPSQGEGNCKLAIYLDYPATIEDRKGKSFIGDNAQFILYCLERMSVSIDDVFLDYIVKCAPYKGKLPGKKAERMECVSTCASYYRFITLDNLPHLKAMVVLGSLGCEVMTQHKAVGDRAGAEWKPMSLLMQQHVNHVWVGFSPGVLREQPAKAGEIYRVIFMAAKEAGLKPKPNLSIKPYEFPDKKR